MQLSPAGERALKLREGPGGKPSLVGYADDNGTPTFGYGTTEGAVIGKTYTEEECDAAFEKACAWVSDCIEKNVKVQLTQSQYDAIFSFVYNVGPGAKGIKNGFAVLKNGQPSTILSLINSRKFDEVPAEMLKWVISGGVRDQGLVNRRNSEGGQWVQGAYVRGSNIDVEAPPPWHKSPVVQKIGAAVVTGLGGVTAGTIQTAADTAKSATSLWHGFAPIAAVLTIALMLWALFGLRKS